jgi:hypothetical protein
MATIGSAGRLRRTAVIALALLATLAIAAPALATSGANAEAAAACQEEGFLDWTDADGNAFRNAGDCVSYAAHGGTLLPVVVDPVNPFSVSYRASGTNGFEATVTGSGLEPGSSVDLLLTWGGEPVPIGDVADASGDVTFTASGSCTSVGSPLTSVSVAGTPAGGEHTEFPVPLPDASICPPPT